MGEPVEELLEIGIHENDPKKVVKIGSTLSLNDQVRYADSSKSSGMYLHGHTKTCWK